MKNKSNKKIYLSAPFLKKNEKKYVLDAVKTGWVSTSGKYINLFENEITKITKSNHAIACINGTSALHIALKLMGVNEGDEVLVPSITFIAPINAVKYVNANPIFFDADKYHNINLDDVKKFIEQYTYFKNNKTYNKKTKKQISAIVIVHVWGNAVDLKKIIPFLKKKNIRIIEDASESLGTTTKNNKNLHTGIAGDIGCISFNANKIATSGGGGAIITNNLKIAKKARYLISQSKNDPIFFKHNDIGYNYKLTNLNAAIGLAQIEQLKSFLIKKKSIYMLYLKLFSKDKDVYLLKPPLHSHSNHWLNVITFDKKIKINLKKLINYLEKKNIEARPVWFPNHLQAKFKKFQKYNIKNANFICKNSLCLPSDLSLTNDDIKRVYNSIINFIR